MIVGAGKLGYKLTEAFTSEQDNVIVIDKDERALERVSLNFDVMTIREMQFKLRFFSRQIQTRSIWQLLLQAVMKPIW